ncbi:MAG: hypothetical protein K5695_04740, partial [Oscillospiraceae bacterium]|nr:hypothetical protein [Oscillospiraceae bacterium]
MKNFYISAELRGWGGGGRSTKPRFIDRLSGCTQMVQPPFYPYLISAHQHCPFQQSQIEDIHAAICIHVSLADVFFKRTAER